jgi:hypothetical protein
MDNRLYNQRLIPGMLCYILSWQYIVWTIMGMLFLFGFMELFHEWTALKERAK